MIPRRQFLQRTALVSLAPLVPDFLARSVLAADARPDDRVLVVIQLDGGNDGLNTVVPYSDELYGRFRSELRIDRDQVHRINDTVGLHPAMKPAAALLDEGRLAIVQGVGYPNPNRSHFESMAIWHHARLHPDDHDGNGWLGRAAEATRKRADGPDSCYLGSGAEPVALRGRRATILAFDDERDFDISPAAATILAPSAPANEVAAFVQRTTVQSLESVKRLRELPQTERTDRVRYPGNELATNLQLVARLLKLGSESRIYYVVQSGYDTHSEQLYQHSRLLDEFSTSLKAFLDDLRAASLDDRVAILAFSEFGRRVQENGSAGTDHGAAGPVFVAGPRLKGGLVGDHPSLADLDDGDLKMSVDFRQVYATLLDQWLNVDSRRVLSEKFEPVSLF